MGTAVYPGAIKTYVDLIDNVDLAQASQPNSLQDEVTAIQTYLGLLVQGPDSTILERLRRGPVQTLTNKSGASRAAGDVVVQDTGNDAAFATTTTANLKRNVYVVRETIADNAVGAVQSSGRVVTVKVTGAVVKGNVLVTSTTSTRAKDGGSADLVDGAFARALTANASGDGTVEAQLFGATLLASNAQRADNLLKNGSFEEYTGADADNWTRAGDLASGHGQDTGSGQFGNSSDITVVNPAGTGTLTQTPLATISAIVNTYFRGKTFSGWCRVRQASGAASITAQLRISDGVGNTDGAAVALPDDGSWVTLEVTRAIDAAATSLALQVRLINGAGGTCSFRTDGACLVLGTIPTEFLAHPDDAAAYA
ncbi:MAG: hypothetical protein HOO67_06230 [Candidatus Peribacteraceae bacterium]|nr:hypothetical protein [Candidatus Peribacteraceae bacterium]